MFIRNSTAIIKSVSKKGNLLKFKVAETIVVNLKPLIPSNYCMQTKTGLGARGGELR